MGNRLDAAKRGFGLHGVRCTAATNLATPSEAVPRPGSQKSTESDSKLTPVISNAQGVSVETYVSVSGPPNSDPISREGLALIWRPAGGAWQGYSGPGFIHSQDQIAEWAADPEAYGTHDAVTIPSTQQIVAFYGQTAGSDPLLYNVRTLNPATWLWGAEVTILSVSMPEKLYDGALCVLGDPAETVLLIRSYVDANSVGAWDVLASTDAGASWSPWSNRPFATITTALTPSPTARCRMKSSGDDVLFMREYSTYAAQFASKSLGATFTQVGADWTTNVASNISLASLGGGAFGALFESGGALKFARIGSAYESIEAAVHVTLVASTVTASTLWVDDLGVLWAAITTDGVALMYSRDLGDTWIGLDASFPLGSDHYSSGDAGSEFAPDTAAMSSGRLVLIGNSIASGGAATYNGRVWAVQSGGWSNLEFQGWINATAGDGLTWFSYELASTVGGWAEITTGGTATLVAPGAMQVVTSSNLKYWQAGADTNARDLVALIDVDVTSGGLLTANVIGGNLNLGDGINRTDVEINFTSTQYSVYDRHAVASRGTFTPTAGRVQVLVYHTWAGGTPTVSTWHRTPGADVWTPGAVAVSATTAASVVISRYQWGHKASGSGDALWYQSHWTWADIDGDLAIAETAGTMRGKAINLLPSALTSVVGDAGKVAFLSVTSGPGIVGYTNAIDVEHDYPKERALVDDSPSSTKKWRSVGTSLTVLAEWSPNEDGEYQTNPGNSTVFLGLWGINFRVAILEGSTDGGATFPHSIGAFDATVNTGGVIKYTYFGEDAVEADPAGSGNNARYVWFNELAGGTAFLSNGGVSYRRIRRNTEGPSNSDETTRNARFWLDGIDGTEPAAGNDLDIWAPRGVAIFHGVGAFDRVRVVIPGQTTADGYFECGRLMYGAVHPAGREWSKGWSITESANARTRREPDGARRVTRQGPTLRDLVVAWPDAVDMTGLHSGNPNYLAADTGGPLAAEDDVAYWLAGIIEYTESGRWPVVALADIPDADTTITDRSLILCGHIASAASFNHVHGVAGVSELGRVQNIKIEELP